ncbi:uncharacterized protein LOC113866546 [Abrus precatorius]|uniref:Uncharacterized protein LOC113866546 n=1 Tax=Abrus precatorius TaxID=3816 RepID=A0A8B8LLN4_ABRPR|nr:uncharacterized protein LOC113866546 [Abrus precatorius]
MDGGDLWRVAACGNSDGAPRDNGIFNRIMLRFRPIAPKPVAGGSVPAAAESSQSSHVSVLGKRPKRKYVRIRRNSGYVRKNGNDSNNSDKSSSERRDGLDDVAVVTLQLMPEKDAPERDSLIEDSWCKNVDLDLTVEKIQIVENLKPPSATANADAGEGSDQVPAVKVVESWVTVESVTGTCMGEGGGLGCTDEEKMKNLETDTCPGFVCDGGLRVRWVNDAYKRMVVSEERNPRAENIVVWLKVKDGAASWWCYSYPAFTCGVRLQYTWRNEKCTKMVPCDVWRLDSGGFAWRLDVKAALSLGL